MHHMLALVFVGLLVTAASQDTSTDNFNDKLNTIDTKPSVRLDPYIRKALLKALTELEDSANFTSESYATDESPTTGSELLRTSDSDKSTPTINANEEIRIHSFIVNGQAAFANNTNATPMLIDNNISILSTTAGNVENQVTATLPTQSPFVEIFQAKESGNIHQVRAITSSTSANTDSSSAKSKPATTTSTISTTSTTTTTTTTTPKPSHNDDGENIEDVDKRDVQVFQAPLVAAFTVHQDAQGQPKKVVPIFQQTNVQGLSKLQPLAATSLPTGVLPPPLSQQLSFQNQPLNKISQSDYINQQLSLQKHLEEKQRIIEEQLHLLQEQQRQQEEILRKQHFLLQQKEFQRQQQQQLDQHRVTGNQINQPPNFQQNHFFNQNLLPQSTHVSIQPSVPIEQNNIIANQQQLPNREAVDFLIHLRSQQQEQFPLQDNHLPQGISNFLQPTPIHQGPKPIDPFRQKQGNRVFRHESGVGNFGFNNQNNQNFQNRFNTLNPNYSNRFYSNRPYQFNSDAELKQLLAQNGLNGRTHEDLNIVSKVLSLNHGIPVNQVSTNRLPFDSRPILRLF